MSNQNRGRGGGRTGGGRQRGGDRRGNNSKQSAHETLYSEFKDLLDGTGTSKKQIMSRMRKENVTASKMNDFYLSVTSSVRR